MTYPPQPEYQAPMPPGDHPRAVPALVLGILGLVVCLFCAPFAWRIGKQAVVEIDASGGQIGGRNTAKAGYILGLIGTIVLVLAALAMVLVIVTGGFGLQVGGSS